MNVTFAATDLLVDDIDWPAGASAALPTSLIVSVPDYLLDSDDDDALDDYIIEAIHDQVGVSPLNSFSFGPC